MTSVDDDNFAQMHNNCVLKCANCAINFADLESFNAHLASCLTPDLTPSIQEKLNHKRDDIFLDSQFHVGRMNRNSRKLKKPCKNCGEFISTRDDHSCNQVPKCHFCLTQVPSKYLKKHVENCQILAEAQLMLFSFEPSQPENVSPSNPQPQSSPPPKSPPQNIPPQNSPAPNSLPQNASRTNSSPENAPPEGARIDDNPISSQESTESRISSSSSNPSQKISSSSDEVTKTASQNHLKYIQKTRKRSFETSMGKILEEERDFERIENEPKRYFLRSKSSFSMENSSDESDENSEDQPSKAEILKKKMRKSNEYRHLSVDINPFVQFVKLAANHEEKRLLIAALLPDHLNDDDLSNFCHLLDVKQDYIRDIHRQRLLKLSEGHHFKIESARKNKGQIRVLPATKINIINDIDKASQLWPGVSESFFLRCSSVTDVSLKQYYNSNSIIVQKRSVENYRLSRKVLPIRFHQFYNEEIKTKYPHISFYQFKEIIPENIFPVNIGWSHSCICHECANFHYSLDLIHHIGEIHEIDALKTLNFDKISELNVCDHTDFHSVQRCLRKRKHHYCYQHKNFHKDCDNCQHKCSSRLTDFLLNELANRDLTFDVRFARLKLFEKNRWLPVKKTDPASAMNALSAVKLAARLLDETTSHRFDVERYKSNKIEWSFEQKSYPPLGLSMLTVDYGSTFSLNLPECGQRQSCEFCLNFSVIITCL